MEFVAYIVLSLLVLMVMITIHELGHYTMARILKIKVKEFSVGFGPKLFWKTNKHGELIAIRAIPLGGFCAFYGEDAGEQKIVEGRVELPNPEQDVDPSIHFNNQKAWKRIIVFLGGATFNIVSALFFTLLFILVVGYGVPKVTEFTRPMDGSLNPNAQILLKDDIIVAVNGKKIDVLNGYSELMTGVDYSTLVITVEREGVVDTIDLTGFTKITMLNKDGDQVTGMGLNGVYVNRGVSFGTAVLQSVPLTWDFGVMILQSLGGLFTGSTKLTDMSGPIGMIGTMASESAENYRFFFLIMPVIAVNLGIFNLLPIPSLDGSKIVFTTIEWIRKKPIKQSIEMWIHFVGIIALLGFVVLIDLLKIFI